MNVKLLRKVQKHILEEPKRLDMGRWIVPDAADTRAYADSAPRCGTVGCIAGWTLLLSKHKVAKSGATSDTIFAAAANLLEISPSEASRLFFVSGWPEQFGERMTSFGYRTPPSIAQNAAIVRERIDHFIKTKGRE